MMLHFAHDYVRALQIFNDHGVDDSKILVDNDKVMVSMNKETLRESESVVLNTLGWSWCKDENLWEFVF